MPLNGHQETTQKSTYQNEVVLEINDIEVISEGTFPINLKMIAQYQQTEPILMDKYEDGMYNKGYFHGGSNIDLNLITCDYNIFIP